MKPNLFLSLTPRFSGVCTAFKERPTLSTVSHPHECVTHLAHVTHVTCLTYLTNRASRFSLAVFVSVIAIFLTGCLFKPTAVSPRHFVLTPISTNEPASAETERLSVGIAHIKMPSYLLQNSIAVRNGTNEIDYLENALWGERLDQCFQRTVAANLSQLLPSDNIYLTDWAHDQVKVRVFVNVQQFDVDSRGGGTLIAQWRISDPDNNTPLKIGRAELTRAGAPPRGHPEAVANTLSGLAADFSRELALALRSTPMYGDAHE